MINSAKWIFIVGCQRSGTTLTGQILGAHSRSFLVDESDGLYGLFERKTHTATVDKEVSDEILMRSRDKYTDQRAVLEADEIVSAYNLVAKAPNLTYDYAYLGGLATRPKIVYPVRDVRSVVASIFDLKKIRIVDNQLKRISNCEEVKVTFCKEYELLTSGDTPLHVKAALIWKIKTGLYTKFREAGLDPLLFQYEKLVTDTVHQVKEISSHCELAFEPQMMDYHTLLNGKGPGNTSRTRSIDESSMLKWKDTLSPDQVADILEVSEGLMLRLGYDLG